MIKIIEKNPNIKERLSKHPLPNITLLWEGAPSPLLDHLPRPIKALKGYERKTKASLAWSFQGLSVEGMDIPFGLNPLCIWAYAPGTSITLPEEKNPALETLGRYVKVLNGWLNTIPPQLSPEIILHPSQVLGYLASRGLEIPFPVKKALLNYRSIIFALSILEKAKEINQPIYAIMERDYIPVVKHLLEKEGVDVISMIE